MSDNNRNERFERVGAAIERCRREMAKRIVGQSEMIDGMLMGLFAGGHVLIEGVPGLAKTLAIKTLAETVDADFRRIQFTPDLLPADLIGTMIYRQETGQFVPRKGPVFSNIILGDEVNRAPAKVQSALLEAMAERQVTLGDVTYPLAFPFFVLATQNPIEHEGTYPLPEAQLDRFLLKLKVNYPSPDDELAILRKMGTDESHPVEKVLSPGMLREIQKTCSLVRVDERIEQYIVSIVVATRAQDKNRYPFARLIEYGASTRATLYLYRCAKIRAVYDSRAYVVPEDVKAVAYDVLRHRLVLSYEAESEELAAENVIESVLNSVAVP